MIRQIVKVQIPIVGSRDDPALVYARGRTKLRQIKITAELKRKMGGRYKAFFYAEFKNSYWVIQEEAPEQDW